MKIILLFVTLIILTHKILAFTELTDNDKLGKILYQEIKRSKKVEDIERLFNTMTNLTLQNKDQIVIEIIRDIKSKDALEIDRTIKNNDKYDLSIVGGRSAFVATKLLDIDLPQINRLSTKEDIGKAIMLIGKKRQFLAEQMVVNDSKLLEKNIAEKIQIASASYNQFMLSALATDTNYLVRKAVASNRYTPAKALSQLMKYDENAEVRSNAVNTLKGGLLHKFK